MDRTACIKMVKNIQSLALNVQNFLENTHSDIICTRCGEKKKGKKRFSSKFQILKAQRLKNISSYEWNIKGKYKKLNDSSHLSEHSPIKDPINTSSSSSQNPFILKPSAIFTSAGSDVQAQPIPLPVQVQTWGSDSTAADAERLACQKEGPLETDGGVVGPQRDGRAEAVVDVSFKVEPAVLIDIDASDQQQSSSFHVDESLPSSRQQSSARPPSQPTCASEVLKSLASKTKSSAAVVTSTSTASPTDGSPSSLSVERGVVEPSPSGGDVGGVGGASQNDPSSADWGRDLPATSTSANAIPNSASDILKSLASSFASKQTKPASTLYPTTSTSITSSESSTGGGGGAHPPHPHPLPPPSTSSSYDGNNAASSFISERQSRPSTEILRNILESLPAEKDEDVKPFPAFVGGSGRAFGETFASMNRSDEGYDGFRLPTSAVTSQMNFSSGIPAIFGGGSKAVSMFSFSPGNNPFVNVNPQSTNCIWKQQQQPADAPTSVNGGSTRQSTTFVSSWRTPNDESVGPVGRPDYCQVRAAAGRSWFERRKAEMASQFDEDPTATMASTSPSRAEQQTIDRLDAADVKVLDTESKTSDTESAPSKCDIPGDVSRSSSGELTAKIRKTH